MISGRKLIVVMPAYNAGRTIEKTWREIPPGVADEVIVTDDGSSDNTAALARRLGLDVIEHDFNRGYGANQKTCYAEALRRGAEVVVMLHPDYQYDPKLVPAMAGPVADGRYDAMLGSRMADGSARTGGMPWWKFLGNRFLTAWQNYCLKQNLSEYHTGYRAFSRRLLETVPLQTFSDGFAFDAEMLVAVIQAGFRIGEIACPTHYDKDSSSVGFWGSVVYGWRVVVSSWRGRRKRLP